MRLRALGRQDAAIDAGLKIVAEPGKKAEELVDKARQLTHRGQHKSACTLLETAYALQPSGKIAFLIANSR